MKKPKHIVKICLLLVPLLIVGAVVAYAGWVLHVPVNPHASEDTVVEFPIVQGQSLRRVTENLQSIGLVRNARLLELYGRFTDRAARIRAGTYPLNPSATPVELLETLVTGRAFDESIRVTIPEGWRIRQIAARLQDFGIADAQAFEDAATMGDAFRRFEVLGDLDDGESLEGFLFPETYRFDADSNPERVAARMVETFSERVGDMLLQAQIDEYPLSVFELVTLASIVQHESPTVDMPQVAGVFHNRLRDGQRLESDATLNFALGTSDRRPTFAQVLTPHPYNTYRQPGLPPGPIGSPGVEAIAASVEPVEHDYYFFLHPLDGRTILSRTYEEHLQNADRYLER